MPSTKRKRTTTTSNDSSDARLWTANNLSPWILDAVATMGFSRMTPVQASTIPLFLANKDVVVEAVTGSGKTLAFLIPVIERLLSHTDDLKKGFVNAIIVSPTRELAMQIYAVCENLLKYYPPSTYDEATETTNELSCPVHPQLLVSGSTTPAQDLKSFLSNSSNLLIATPGRLNDLLASPYCHTSSFDVLVLDEADRLLDLGFKDTLVKILARLPKQRRTGLFSASITDAVEGVMSWIGIRNGVRVNVRVRGTGDEEQRTPASLDIGYLSVQPSQKLFYISEIIKSCSPVPQKIIIYLATCHGVDYFAHLLPVILPNYALTPLHGKQPPNARTKHFDAFSSSSTPSILLTTDVAARGLDVPAVDLVIQVDPPQDPKQFLHRCGRSGRAGRRGRAILLLTKGKEEDYIPFLQVRKTPIRLITDEEIPPPTQDYVDRMSAKMRKLILGDRAIYEKGLRAFVSWVRSYKAHVASAIFRIEDVDWTELARGWILIKLPRMPELKHIDSSTMESINTALGSFVDTDGIAFKDKTREKLRLEENANKDTDDYKSKAKQEKNTREDRKKKNVSWSAKTESKEEREMRREKKRKRREMEKLEGMSEKERTEHQEWRDMVEEVKRNKKKQDDEVDGWTGFED